LAAGDYDIIVEYNLVRAVTLIDGADKVDFCADGCASVAGCDLKYAYSDAGVLRVSQRRN